jgi:UMF1 family MFS transporter
MEITAARLTRSTKRERTAWYLYDFGNSAYAAVVLLAVYSAYFQGTVVGGARGTRLWGLAVGIAMLIVAVSSPILGAIADFTAAKKRFLLFYTSLACAFTALLFFVRAGDVAAGVLLFVVAEVGYRSAQVFYNALLPEIAAPEEIGHVSGIGWAIGSAGGVVCLIIVLGLITAIGGQFVVRLSLVITALFFAVSAVPVFLWLPERARGQHLPAGETYLTVGFRRLAATFKDVRRFKQFVRFMIAFLVYNDGVIMALDFAAILGAVLFGLNQQGLIIFIIIVQITNVIGAYLFGWMADRFGVKDSLLASLVIMIGAVIGLFFNQTQIGFFIIGAVAGFAMAGLQSLSRTMVGKLTPPGQSAEFYGFFAVAGRSSSFIGPTVYGFLAAALARTFEAGGQSAALAEQSGLRYAIFAIAAFLVAGLVALLLVNEREGQRAAGGE